MKAEIEKLKKERDYWYIKSVEADYFDTQERYTREVRRLDKLIKVISK